MRTFFALAVLLTTTVSFAQEDNSPILVVTKTGFYLLTADANGVPVTTRITKVVTTNGMPPVGGPDTPTPPIDVPPQESEITKQVREWAKEVDDPRGAQAISLVIKQVVTESQKGNIADADIYTAINRANDAVLKSLGTLDKWADVRSSNKLGGLLTKLAQTGGIPNQKAKERILLEVAAGFETAHTGASAALNGELLQKILQIVMMILQAFFVGGGGSTI